MVTVIQRVKSASVAIENETVGAIENGLLVLLGVAHGDTKEDLDWVIKKVSNMRIFSDKEGKMNLSLLDTKAELLLVSQFTLLASTKKGNRPSYTGSALPEEANKMYELAIAEFSKVLGKDIQTGEFGADMKVSLVNDGPVTIILDSKNKK